MRIKQGQLYGHAPPAHPHGGQTAFAAELQFAAQHIIRDADRKSSYPNNIAAFILYIYVRLYDPYNSTYTT